MTIELALPRLRPDQYAIAMHPAPVKVLSMGRRWGKTVLGGALVLNVLRQHGRAAWIVPTYKNGRSLWRYVQNVCAPLAQEKLMDISKSERMVTTTRGGLLGIYSADNIDAIRSEAFNLVVIDEAARVSEEARNDAILPTLADAGGQELDISSPKGMNWFATEWQRGQDDGQAIMSWRAPSCANPNPNIQQAYQLLKARVAQGDFPARSFDQEWDALFVADGNYFQRVAECCTLLEPDRPADHNGHTIGMGLDWGKVDDFTSGTVGCRECDRVVDWLHMNKFDYKLQVQAVVELARKWTQTHGPDGKPLPEPVQPRILPERNSIGSVNIETLRDAGLRIETGPDGDYGWQMGATNKPALIDNLALALQRGRKFPKSYVGEFTVYEVKTGKDGQPTFSAPEGMHDDRVISAALDNHLSISGMQIF